MKKSIFIFSILFILILIIFVDIINIKKTQKAINRLKKEEISFITIIYENKKSILTGNENIMYEIVNIVDNILSVKKDDLNQSFMRGDAQDVIEIIITNKNNTNLEIIFAYSYAKELCRISVSTESVKNIYKIINLSEETFNNLVSMSTEKNK
jgi:hypothetical protein